jgi:hypothetical protein
MDAHRRRDRRGRRVGPGNGRPAHDRAQDLAELRRSLHGSRTTLRRSGRTHRRHHRHGERRGFQRPQTRTEDRGRECRPHADAGRDGARGDGSEQPSR